jgi:hypothetical protein
MKFCQISFSQKLLNIINDVQLGLISLSLISSIIMIILVIIEIKKKYRSENILGLELSKFIICIGIFDLSFELPIIIENIFQLNQNTGIDCKNIEMFLMIGVMGEYITFFFL